MKDLHDLIKLKKERNAMQGRIANVKTVRRMLKAFHCETLDELEATLELEHGRLCGKIRPLAEAEAKAISTGDNVSKLQKWLKKRIQRSASATESGKLIGTDSLSAVKLAKTRPDLFWLQKTGTGWTIGLTSVGVYYDSVVADAIDDPVVTFDDVYGPDEVDDLDDRFIG